MLAIESVGVIGVVIVSGGGGRVGGIRRINQTARELSIQNFILALMCVPTTATTTTAPTA